MKTAFDLREEYQDETGRKAIDNKIIDLDYLCRIEDKLLTSQPAVSEESIKAHLTYFGEYIIEAITKPVTFIELQAAVDVWLDTNVGKELLKSLNVQGEDRLKDPDYWEELYNKFDPPQEKGGEG